MLAGFCLMIPSASADDLPHTAASVVLSAGVNYRFGGKIEPQQVTNQFDCGDQIYAVVALDSQQEGEHQLDWVWRRPDRKIAERSTYQWLSRGDPQLINVARWIHFRQGRGTSMVGLFDPAFGYESYIGEWQLELLLDHQPLIQKSFSVLC